MGLTMLDKKTTQKNLIDITGKRYGKWLVLEYLGKGYWLLNSFTKSISSLDHLGLLTLLGRRDLSKEIKVFRIESPYPPVQCCSADTVGLTH